MPFKGSLNDLTVWPVWGLAEKGSQLHIQRGQLTLQSWSLALLCGLSVPLHSEMSVHEYMCLDAHCSVHSAYVCTLLLARDRHGRCLCFLLWFHHTW